MGLIDIRVTGGDEIQVRMSEVYPAVISGVMSAMARIDQELAAFIVEQRLSGQVLNKVTGRLQSSITPFPVVEGGGTVTGGVFQDDEVAPYGKFHELGADIPERFGNPMRFLTREGNVVFATRARGFRLPIRSFMFSAATEFHAAYESAMRDEFESNTQGVWNR